METPVVYQDNTSHMTCLHGPELKPVPLENESPADAEARLCRALGTSSSDAARYIVNFLDSTTRRTDEERVNALLATVVEGKPSDPQELLLLAQMACVSQIMLDAVRQIHAMHIDPVDQDELSRLISRYGHLYARQMEALRKYRRNGQQTVTVVHADKAIVGDVHTGSGGGGCDQF